MTALVRLQIAELLASKGFVRSAGAQISRCGDELLIPVRRAPLMVAPAAGFEDADTLEFDFSDTAGAL